MEPEEKDIKKILEEISKKNLDNPAIMELVFPYDNELFIFELKEQPLIQYFKHKLRKAGVF